MSAPRGTVTFLFTDIESSTRLWEQHADAMQPAVAMHDSILRKAVEDNAGSVVKTTGDGIHAVFARAGDAVAAAVEAQRFFADTAFAEIGRLSVRMGVHTGEGFERDGDYFGSAVNRAARIMAAARGGQILSSHATHLVAGKAVSDATTIDLGHVNLPGLVDPEHVHQIVAPGLTAAFAPLPAADAFPNNLPATVTDFVGRTDDMSAVSRLLAQTRIVTVTGPGGVGKTRLVLEACRREGENHPDGVWFVDLSAITAENAVVGAVAGSVGVADEPGRSLTEGVAAFLASRRLLLVLDNCEQVLGGVRDAAASWLRAAPDLHLLMTSRELLGVPGESVWPLAPLGRDSEDGVQLFLARAEAANPRLELAAHLDEIVELCRDLEGLPLAIELAAARVTALLPSQIRERLDDQLRILRRRGDGQRHGSLEAAIEWSYRLLEPEEARLFAAMSVFPGGFDLAATEGMAAAADVDEPEVVDLLTSLVNKSLVTIEPGSDQIRYRYLETVRRFALNQLSEFERTDATLRAQVDWALRLAAGGPGHAQFHGRREWAVLLTDRRNLEAALAWAVTHGHGSEATRLAQGLQNIWVWIAYRQGLAWMAQILALPDLPPHDRATMLCEAAWLEWQSGRQGETTALLEEAQQLAGGHGFPLPLQGLLTLAFVHSFNDRPDLALANAEKAVQRTKSAAHSGEGQPAAYMMTWAYLSAGDFDQAKVWSKKAVDFARHHGSPEMLARSLILLGRALRSDAPQEAVGVFDEMIELAVTAGSRWWQASGVLQRGYCLLRIGDRSGALAEFARAASLAHEAHDMRAFASAVEGIASLVARRGAHRDAVRLLGGAARLRRDLGNVVGLHDEVVHRTRLVERLQSELGEAFEAAWADGETLDASFLAAAATHAAAQAACNNLA